MALEQKLSLKLSQKLVMTPSLQQAIKLLQMTRLELEGVLTKELIENPVLEELEVRDESGGVEEGTEGESKEVEESLGDIDLDAYFGDYAESWEGGGRTASTFEERQGPPLENTLTHRDDLYDHLLWQLHMMDVPPLHREIAELIIGNLDPDGFLAATIEEIQAMGADGYVEGTTRQPPPEPISPERAAESTAESAATRSAESIGALPQPRDAGASHSDSGASHRDSGASHRGADGFLPAQPPQASAPPSVDLAGGRASEGLEGAGPGGLGAEADARAKEAAAAEAAEAEAARASRDADSADGGETVSKAGPKTGAETGADFASSSDADAAPAEVPGYPRLAVEQALALVRTLDPPGVATVDLRTALVAQLDSAGEPEDSLARRVVEEKWDLFTRRKFEQIAKDFEIPLQSLKPAVERIASLDTRPGRKYDTEDTRYVEPDVHVVKVGEEYVVQLNDNGLPRLRVSRAYRKMLRELRAKGSEAEAKQYIQEKMRSALWLIKSLDQRQRTIFKVTTSIIKQQRGFFDHGVEHLRPMVLRDVAEDIEMHESTVSRVVSNKYVHTPRGLLPMKFFFHSGIDRDYGGDISSLSVKRKIEHLVQAEDPKKPLSDSALMKILNREGINIARRTVAKYRDELGIPSSTDRKKIF